MQVVRRRRPRRRVGGGRDLTCVMNDACRVAYLSSRVCGGFDLPWPHTTRAMAAWGGGGSCGARATVSYGLRSRRRCGVCERRTLVFRIAGGGGDWEAAAAGCVALPRDIERCTADIKRYAAVSRAQLGESMFGVCRCAGGAGAAGCSTL